MFQDPRKNLYKDFARATEKAIREAHTRGLLEFDRLKEAGELPENKSATPEQDGGPGPGTILVSMDGCGPTSKHVISRKIESSFGDSWEIINLKTRQIRQADHIRHITKKFGIGTYWTDEKMPEAELANLIIEAQEKKKKDEARRDAAATLAAQVRAGKIEEGKKLVSIPDWAKSVIVADHYQNDSDSMTDYFSTSITVRIFLAYSKTQRNNMAELRAACANFDEVKDFPAQADANKEAREYNTPAAHTEGHSYLPDYYIGTGAWHGYKVTKDKYFDLSREENREQLYIAAAEGRYNIPETAKAQPKTERPAEAAKKDERPAPVSDGVRIVEYSDKAIAVTGNTRPLKDELKAAGGRWNPRLKCGPGWIFSRRHEATVRAIIEGNPTLF